MWTMWGMTHIYVGTPQNGKLTTATYSQTPQAPWPKRSKWVYCPMHIIPKAAQVTEWGECEGKRWLFCEGFGMVVKPRGVEKRACAIFFFRI